MKRIISALIALSLTVVCFAGCSKDDSSESKKEKKTKAETTTTTAATTKAPEKTTPEVTTTEMPDTPPEELDEIGEVFKGFSGFDKSTGYVAATSAEIESALAIGSNFSIASLATTHISDDITAGLNETTLYSIEMVNTVTADLMDGLHVIELSMPTDDNYYLVTFGNSSSTSAEVDPYCFVNEVVTYYSAITEVEGIYVAIPLIGGNDELGYWAIKPALAMAGLDVSSMATLNTGSPAPPSTTTSSTTTPSSKSNSGEDLVFEITGTEYSDDYTDVNYTITNNLSVPVWIEMPKVTLNGKDVTEDFSIYIEVDANKTTSDTAFYAGKISAGDTLVISGMAYDSDTYTALGEVEFPITLR